jgi:hypothetical protein
MRRAFTAATILAASCISAGVVGASPPPSPECPSSVVKVSVTAPTDPTPNPGGYADLVEVVRGTVGKPISSTIWEVDTNSVVEVNLFKGPIPGRDDTEKLAAVGKIKVAITLYKGDATTDFTPPDAQWTLCGNIYLGPKIDMNDGKIQDKDLVGVTITNTASNQSVTYSLTRKELGWHRSISDTVSFVRRLGVSKNDVTNGVTQINFAPTPGVTLATVYEPRRDEKVSFMHFLAPGVGITASFLDWKDQNVMVDTSDPNKPVFPSGTKSSDINLGLGGQVSLFQGQISFLYGWNLQTTGPRRYWGVGVSFVNVYQYISNAISATKPTVAANPKTPAAPALVQPAAPPAAPPTTSSGG